MSKLIVNCETGEETLMPLSEEDIAQQKIDEIKYLELKALEVAAAQTKAAAEAKLAALGLTTEDLKALGLGGN